MASTQKWLMKTKQTGVVENHPFHNKLPVVTVEAARPVVTIEVATEFSLCSMVHERADYALVAAWAVSNVHVWSGNGRMRRTSQPMCVRCTPQ